MKKLTQLNLFDNIDEEPQLEDEQLIRFVKQSKTRSKDMSSAISRMMRAKRYHEIASRLSELVVNLRVENEKLRSRISLMKQAN